MIALNKILENSLKTNIPLWRIMGNCFFYLLLNQYWTKSRNSMPVYLNMSLNSIQKQMYEKNMIRVILKEIIMLQDEFYSPKYCFLSQ